MSTNNQAMTWHGIPRDQAGMTYEVTVTRQDEARAIATTRGHELALNVKKGDGTAGFNAAETKT